MSELIGMLEAAKGSANLVREYALDHYVHFGFLPSDVEVDGHVFGDQSGQKRYVGLLIGCRRHASATQVPMPGMADPRRNRA